MRRILGTRPGADGQGIVERLVGGRPSGSRIAPLRRLASSWRGIGPGAADRDGDSFGRLPGALDEQVISRASRYGVPLLRYSLAANFIWFGALKITNRSPVGELVADTVYWVPPRFFVPFLGLWEIAVGLGLVSGLAPRTTLTFFLMQMVGTFLVFVEKPDVAFQSRNPLLLTTEGEFVVKNLILISAGIVIASTVRRREERGK